MSVPATMYRRDPLRLHADMRPAIRRALFRLSDKRMDRYLCFVADPDLARMVATRARQEGLNLSDTIRKALVATYRYAR